MLLRAVRYRATVCCYVLCSTELAYAATGSARMLLRGCYAMRGTELAYATTTGSPVPPVTAAVFGPTVCRNTVPGTDLDARQEEEEEKGKKEKKAKAKEGVQLPLPETRLPLDNVDEPLVTRCLVRTRPDQMPGNRAAGLFVPAARVNGFDFAAHVLRASLRAPYGMRGTGDGTESGYGGTVGYCRLLWQESLGEATDKFRALLRE
eukprot:1999469-Rhodomonas_salina.1